MLAQQLPKFAERLGSDTKSPSAPFDPEFIDQHFK